MMNLELVKPTIQQKPILANLLELYAYEFSKFTDVDIGSNGCYGYTHLPSYWIESSHFPFLIYVNKKIAGFILVQNGSPLSDDRAVWDFSEFFVMNKYKRCGVGTAAVFNVWEQFKGEWQVRVLETNHIADLFWRQAIIKFTSVAPAKTKAMIKGEAWVIYTFESKNRTPLL